jgi:hypothetical protein
MIWEAGATRDTGGRRGDLVNEGLELQGYFAKLLRSGRGLAGVFCIRWRPDALDRGLHSFHRWGCFHRWVGLHLIRSLLIVTWL